MYLRMLRSSFLPDFQAEILSIGVPVAEHTLREQLNPALTIKFADLSPSQYPHLITRLGQQGITFWTSQSPDGGACIATFGNWESIDRLMAGEGEVTASLAAALEALKKNIWRDRWEYTTPGGYPLTIDRPLLMGILNVTPDSFSDGGRYFRTDQAVHHAREMAEAGADLIDIGAESTRPGAEAVSLEEEWGRLQPLLRKLVPELKIPVSIDTYKAEIARRALQEGAALVNDISGLTFDPGMPEVVARAGCPLVIMHIRGTPRDMQKKPHYENLMEEIYRFFVGQIAGAKQAGITRLMLDPGIGFGKRWEDNFEIIRRLGEFTALGYPVLAGVSRKSFIGRLLEKEAGERLIGTAAATALAVQRGAKIIRVHDVPEMREVVKMVAAIGAKKYGIPDKS